MPWEARIKGKLRPLPGGTAPPQPHEPLSSVLALLGVETDTQEEKILLMKRTMDVVTHKGQVSFPGGYYEPQDPSLLATALRETWEEIGMRSEHIRVLGGLSPIQTLGDVWIYPWVGEMTFPYPFALNPTEVDRLLFLPVRRLLEEGLKPVTVPIEGRKVKSIGIELDGELVWGATAKMLEELRQLLL